LPAQQLGIPLHLLQYWPFNKRRCKKIAGSTVGHPSIPSLLQTSYSSPATVPLKGGTHHFQLYSAIQTHHTILSSSPTDAPATVPFFNGVPIFKLDSALLPLSLYRAVPIDTTASTLLYSTQLYPLYHQYTTFTTPSLQRAP
jgi:hypothetical protein